MSGFFYNLGRLVGPQLRKANWVYHSLTGTEADAVRAEYAVGRDLAWAMAQQMEVERDPDVARFLDDLGARLAACVADRDRRFYFRAVRAPEVNAFALPGGFIFLTRSLLELCDWDCDETAFVMGHEMGHVLRQHAIERIMANSVLRTALSKFSLGKGLLGVPLTGLLTQLLNQGYSREQELDADLLGVRLAAAAGFDAGRATWLLARLATQASDPATLGSYFASHPPFGVRIQNVQRFLDGER
jgi:predicted Zn-dependent protease